MTAAITTGGITQAGPMPAKPVLDKPTRAAFVIPGDLGLPTGGYGYDRRVLALLPAAGIDIRHVALPGSYPTPSTADLAAGAAIMSALPRDTLLLIDGLALGAMPAAVVASIAQPIVALCHHPLALEAGLTAVSQAHFRATETAALSLARHVVVTSAMTKQILVAEFGVAAGRVTIAEPGTDPALRAKQAEGGPAAPVRLLAVGSIVPRKGYDVLVQALAGLQHLDWQLTIAGSDDRSPVTTLAVKAAIRDAGLGDRVTMIGAVATSELERLYAAADLFLMPSLFEGYGMAMAEAMARGLAVVCTTGGAAAETVPDAAAIKVAPGDAVAFRGAVACVLGDPVLRQRMADASWTAGQHLPRWADTARIIADVLQQVWQQVRA